MQVYVTPEEVKQIKGAGEGGMTLLGFKPARWASAFVTCVVRVKSCMSGKRRPERCASAAAMACVAYVDSCMPGS